MTKPVRFINRRHWLVTVILIVLAWLTMRSNWSVIDHRNFSSSENNQTIMAKPKQNIMLDLPYNAIGPNYRHPDDDIASSNMNMSSMPVFVFPIGPGCTECPNYIYEEGTTHSKSLQAIPNINSSMLFPRFVWLHQSTSNRWGPVCYPDLLEQARASYHSHVPTNNTHALSSTNNDYSDPQGTIHVLDWFDLPNVFPRCRNMEELVGLNNIHYWKRSIVQGRRWNNVTQTIDLGHIMSHVDGMPVKFLPYVVRSDVVDGITNVVRSLFQDKERNGRGDSVFTVHTSMQHDMQARALTDYLVTKDRPGDVVHYWPINGSKGGISRGNREHDTSIFRTVTSQTLLDMSHAPYNIPNVLCDIRGSAGRRGRAKVTSDYVESMLHYKIIVVVQRDEWEGHIRLWEAMISGAMVIHDRILAMPLGLEDKVNIVFFDTLEELKQKVVYYLKHTRERLDIARRGRQLAMCQHRSWHRLEQVIFGRTISSCDE
jgi:hypothetical protein